MSNETSQDEQTTSSTGSRFGIRQVVGVVVLVAFVVFLVENNHDVTVRLLVPERRISLSIALLIAGVLGALAMLLFQHRRHRR
jgi:uncharacterized integral membrane protein